jgi:hypothetical protein
VRQEDVLGAVGGDAGAVVPEIEAMSADYDAEPPLRKGGVAEIVLAFSIFSPQDTIGTLGR